jgi:hypothetical protein
MRVRPNGGCYGLCYAAKVSKFYGYDFTKSVSRKMEDHKSHDDQILFDFAGDVGSSDIARMVKNHPLKWFRIGTMGDPCHDWELTIRVCEWLCEYRVPIIISKHWIKIPDDMLPRFSKCGAIINTSISALDTVAELRYRLKQIQRFKDAEIKSVARIVSCKFGDTEEGKRMNAIQEKLFELRPVIDNPLRIPATDKRVISGDIVAEKMIDMTASTSISLHNKKTYIGHCNNCPDQCGVTL